jgi:hypothetical protein
MKRYSLLLVQAPALATLVAQPPKAASGIRLELDPVVGVTAIFRVTSSMRIKTPVENVEVRLSYSVSLNRDEPTPDTDALSMTGCFQEVRGSHHTSAESFSFGVKEKSITNSQKEQLRRNADGVIYLLEQTDKPFTALFAKTGEIKEIKNVVTTFRGSMSSEDMCRSLLRPIIPQFPEGEIKKGGDWRFDFSAPIEALPIIFMSTLGIEECTSTTVRLTMAGKADLDKKLVANTRDLRLKMALERFKVTKANIRGNYKVSRDDGFFDEGKGTLNAVVRFPPEFADIGWTEGILDLKYTVTRVPPRKGQ